MSFGGVAIATIRRHLAEVFGYVSQEKETSARSRLVGECSCGSSSTQVAGILLVWIVVVWLLVCVVGSNLFQRPLLKRKGGFQLFQQPLLKHKGGFPFAAIVA